MAPALLWLLLPACTLYLDGDGDGDSVDDDRDGCGDEPPPCLSCDAEAESPAVCVDGDWQCPIAHCQLPCAPAEQGYFCVYACGDDYSVAEECVQDGWQCPEGTRDGNECPFGTCWGLPPSCCIDGQAYDPICDQGSYVCASEGQPSYGDCEVVCSEQERPVCVESCDGEPLEPSCVSGELQPEGVWQCPAGSFDAGGCPGDPP